MIDVLKPGDTSLLFCHLSFNATPFFKFFFFFNEQKDFKVNSKITFFFHWPLKKKIKSIIVMKVVSVD